ncbi:MAG TPA: hypothetical protein VK659_17315 [Asanoa sp.]|nr:hypothetical protein [Asanoa sp.]
MRTVGRARLLARTLDAVTPLAAACDRRGWTLGPLAEHRIPKVGP